MLTIFSIAFVFLEANCPQEQSFYPKLPRQLRELGKPGSFVYSRQFYVQLVWVRCIQCIQFFSYEKLRVAFKIQFLGATGSNFQEWFVILLSMLECRFGWYISFFGGSFSFGSFIPSPGSHNKQHCVVVWYPRIGLDKSFILIDSWNCSCFTWSWKNRTKLLTAFNIALLLSPPSRGNGLGSGLRCIYDRRSRLRKRTSSSLCSGLTGRATF